MSHNLLFPTLSYAYFSHIVTQFLFYHSKNVDFYMQVMCWYYVRRQLTVKNICQAVCWIVKLFQRFLVMVKQESSIWWDNGASMPMSHIKQFTCKLTNAKNQFKLFPQLSSCICKHRKSEFCKPGCTALKSHVFFTAQKFQILNNENKLFFIFK